MIVAGEPMHRVDLVDHPLIGNAGRVGPEQPKLDVLPRIERFEGPVDEKALPVNILLAQLRNQIGPPPTTRLVYVPSHLGHHDVAKLTRFDELISAHVTRR